MKSKSSNGNATGNVTDDSSIDASPMRQLTIDFLKQHAEIEQGGGKAGQDRQHKLGRLFVRERLGKLLDPKSYWLEVQLWAGYGMYDDVGGVPAAGVVTGIGLVHNRPVMVVANDATVKAGAFFPATAKKVLRAQKIATRCNLPLIYLVDSAGVFLPMQDEIFPDEDDFGRIFRNNAVISAMGIPQIAAVMGNCVAGGAYLPVLCDKLLMTKGSEMYLAGPSLVKAAIGQQVDGEDLGGAKMHSQISGTADFFEENDDACLTRMRALIEMLPEVGSVKIDSKSSPAGNPNDLYNIVSHDGRKEYDAHELLKCICDADSIHEYKADYGKSIVCAYAHIGGRKVGILANQKVRIKSPRGELQIGGVIYHDSSDKAARFIMDCNQSQLPLIFFQDVTGFMVGRESEQSGIIRSGAKLVNAVSNSVVPKITVIVGGSF
ncbi:MAG TPA: carboxyl transferase domain-containing protein, partial [Tepidisphaeraceae bacterium]|nr:carboxyl transferase domain-containing protein [Tepidisphaeraceae bacterium]